MRQLLLRLFAYKNRAFMKIGNGLEAVTNAKNVSINFHLIYFNVAFVLIVPVIDAVGT